MRATILRQLDLPNLPSASGVEIVGETVYIIGDDSPYLYRFTATDLVPGKPLTLFETAHFSSGRIDKAIKADLECLTALTTSTGEMGLLAFGSGATAARENGFWVPLSPAQGEAATVHPVSLSGLYAQLRTLLPAGATLNLEAAATTDTELLLFQRTVGSTAGNLVFRMPLAPTLDFLHHRATQLPTVRPQLFQLPNIKGKPAGFSGACTYEDKLFVTASVEDTADAILDGEVLGSFVGLLDLDQSANKPVTFAQLQLAGGKPYTGKVESVAIRRRLAASRYELLLVTDDDQGGSTAVLVDVTV
ncbi:hypothetical protein MTX78_06715 [Hymenobacter tibetensis]|uniref:Uncharacterized protein n=1 Tax=Hymenobacter tibetensis TaxID=497967 RepID=A0ABY4D548_9BACT|nr:hypothetical protein [Hymenobacter tibetensis]UOG76286.1 hypothetical protein MTX78_06715 [Hymenobacter tibetensis]